MKRYIPYLLLAGMLVAMELILLSPNVMPIVDAAKELIYRSPFTVAATTDGSYLYVAEYTANRLAVVDFAKGQVQQEISLPGSPSGVAVSPDGKLLYVTIAEAQGKVTVIDSGTGKVQGYPYLVGHTPMSPVLDAASNILFVCNRFSNSISILDLLAHKEVTRISVPREPVAAALTNDGHWLAVANLLPSMASTAPVVSAMVTIIDAPARKVAANIPLPDGSSSVRGLCLSADGQFAYVTHILAHYKLPTTQVDHGWMNDNALSIIDITKQQVLATVLLDNIYLGAANPWGVACSPDGAYLCITHAGTHEISIIDRAALHKKLSKAVHPENDLSFMADIRRRITLPGNGPRGLCIVNGTAYIAQYFSNDLAALALAPENRLPPRTISLGSAQPLTVERKGELYFNDGTRCFQQWQSCESCHPNARNDGLNWDLLNDGLGNPKNSKSMLLAHQTPPAMVTGIRASAEVAVRAGMKFIQFHITPDEDAVAIDSYLKSMPPVPSPYLENGKLSTAAIRGRQIFKQAGCATCHPAPLYTDLKLHDAGIGSNEETGRKFDTPTLVECWRTAPYLYDGRAATMREVLEQYNPADQHGQTSKLTAQQLDDLAMFVLSL